MTEKELELIQECGVSSFTLYKYLSTYPDAKNREVEDDLYISIKTFNKCIELLEKHNIITKSYVKNRRTVFINKEEEWSLQ